MSTRGRRSEPTPAGRWLRQQRERLGIATQAELDRRLGWNKGTVNNYETRDVMVSDERAEQLAELFGLDIITVRRNLGLWVPGEDVGATSNALPVPTDEKLRQSGLAPETVEALLAMRRSVERFVEQRNESAIRRANRVLEALDEEQDAG
jgi:transcriptional regulator with XRE-family HTH domain